MQADADFFGLAAGDGPGRFRFTVANHLTRHDGRLYGGTAIAVSLAAAQLVSERTAVWMTTQFVSTAPEHAEVSVLAEVLAPGKRTNQVRVTATDADGAVMFASLGATGHHRDSGLAGVYENAPRVAPPEESPRWRGPFSGLAKLLPDGVEPPTFPEVGFSTVIEYREPEIVDHPDPGPGRMCLWARRKDREPISAAVAAFIADMVPLSIAQAGGVVAAGTSLDNTMRIGAFVESEWILLDLRPHVAAGDYGHGVAHVWTSDGRLVATASQTASLRVIDLAALLGG